MKSFAPTSLLEDLPADPLLAGAESLERSGRIDDLVRLYQSRAFEVPEPFEASRLLCKAAELLRNRSHQLPMAEELYRRALLILPEGLEPLKGLRLLYEQSGDYACLTETLERLAKQVPASESAALLLKAADFYEQKLHRKDRAVLCCQRASRVDSKDRRTFRRIRQLFLSERRYLSAFESLEHERAALGKTAMAAEYAGLAEQLVEDPFGHDLANNAIRISLSLEPGNARAEKVHRAIQNFKDTWRDRIRVLRTASLEEKDPRAAARLSLLVAKTFAWNQIDATAKIQEALDRCFKLWPAMAEALELVEYLAEKSRDFKGAAAGMEQQAIDCKEPRPKAEYWTRAGIFKLCRMSDPVGALKDFEKAAEADPSQAEAIGLGTELMVEQGRAGDALAVLEAHLATVKGRPAQIGLRLRLAELYLDLGNMQLARTHLEAVLTLDPLNATAALQLATVAIEDKNFDRFEAIFDLAVYAIVPAAERAAFLDAVVGMCAAQEDSRRAFQILRQVLLQGRNTPQLVSALGARAKSCGAEWDLALALKQAAQSSVAAEGTDLWRSLAQLLQSSLARPDEAGAAWGEVLRRAPGDPGATAALAALKKSAPKEPDATVAALPVLKKSVPKEPDATAAALLVLKKSAPKEPDATVAALPVLKKSVPKEPDATAAALPVLKKSAPKEPDATAPALPVLKKSAPKEPDATAAALPVLKKSKSKEPALAIVNAEPQTVSTPRKEFDSALRGLAADPANPSLRSGAIQMAKALSAQKELAELLAPLAEQVPDSKLALSLLQDAAALFLGVGVFDEAAGALQLALRHSPDDPEILGRLVQIYSDAKRWAECDQALRRRILVAEDQEKGPLYLKLAEVNGALSRPREAAQALQGAIKSGASEAQLLPRLCELLEETGQVEALSTALARRIELAQASDDRELGTQLENQRSQLRVVSHKSREETIRRCAEVLRNRPFDASAIGELETLLGDPSCSEEAARALLVAYEWAKDHRKLISALDVIAETAKDSLERLLALKRSAYIHLHQLRQPELAFTALVRALRLSPADAALRNVARQAAEDANAVDTFAEVMEELLEADLGPARIALHRELAGLYEKKLSNPAGAITHLNKALTLEPKNQEMLRMLQRLYRAREEWGPLAEVLEKLADDVPEAAQKISLWREAASLHELHLVRKQNAVACWRKIAEQDGLDREAASALDRLYTELDQPRELAFALDLRRTQEGQSPQAREIAYRLAQLRQQRLSDVTGALQLYRQILSEDPAHPKSRAAVEELARSTTPESASALEIIDPVFAQSGEHARRVGIRETRIATALPQERVRLAGEIRGIYEREMGRPELAFAAAATAFAEALDRSAIQPDLERLARETDSFDPLAQVYENAAEAMLPGDEAISSMLRRAAELREQLGQTDHAIRLWRELLAEAPQDRHALDSLGKLYEQSKNATSLSEIFSRRAQLAANPDERAPLLLKAGAAHEAAGNDEAAIDAFRASLVLQKTLEALESLDRLLAKTQRFAEQADILDQLADLVADPRTKKPYLIRRAHLLEREGQPSAAVGAYEDALAFFPREPILISGLEHLIEQEPVKQEVARILEPMYRSANDSQKLVEVLEIRLAVAEPEKRFKLLTEIATLRELLGQKALAFNARLRAFAENPESDSAREELHRLAADTGCFEDLVRAYEEQLERGLSAKVAADVWRRLAVVYGERLNRSEMAAKAWEEVAEREPENAMVLETLAGIHRKMQSHRLLAAVMKRQIQLDKSVSGQVNLLLELAKVAEDSLADRELAIESLQGVLKRKPDDANAIKALDAVLASSEHYPELASLIEREIKLAEEAGALEEAAELTVRLGRLKLSRLQDPRGALELFQEVLRRRANHAAALGALEEMARSDHPLRGEAAAVLEPMFATSGQYLKLVQMLESRISSEAQPQERAKSLCKVSELYSGSLENWKMAFLSAARALREMPDYEEALTLCVKTVGPAEATGELVAVLSEIAVKASHDGARASIYAALAKVQDGSSDPEQAAASWKKVLDLQPSNREALENVARLFKQMGKAKELLEVLRRQASTTEDGITRASLLFQIGALQQDPLRDDVGALTTFRRLLELQPNSEPVLERLEQLCQKLERWPELADVWGKRLQIQGKSATADLKFRLGTLRELRLMDRSGALDLYIEILATAPAHPGALGRVEEMVAAEPQDQAIAGVLLNALRANGDRPKLLQILEAQVQALNDVRQRKMALIELAELREKDGAPELAFLAYWRAFKEDPNDPDLRRRLEAAAELAKTYDELCSAYEEQLPRIAEASDAAQVCLILADLLDQKIQEPSRAIVFYEKARQLNPAAVPKALVALDRLYSQLDQPKALADVLEGLAEQSSDPQEKVSLLFRLGQLAQNKLEDPPRAAAAYERVLVLDTTHLASARSLEHIYQAAGQQEKLYAILKHQRELGTGREKERALSRMAQVASEGLSDVGNSIDLYRELLAKNPRNEAAFAALEQLLDKAERFPELKELLSTQLHQILDPRELARVNARLGQVLFEKLKQPEAAIEPLKATLDRDPRHKPSLETLRVIYESLGRNEELALVLRRLVPLQESTDGVKELRIRLAELLAQLGRKEEALDAARRALEIEPHRPAELGRLQSIFSSLKAFGEAVRVIELRSQIELGLEDRDRAVASLFEIADLWKGPAGKPESAGGALEKVLEIDPSNRPAYERAKELYAQLKDWRPYAQLIDRYLPHLVTEEEKVLALRDLAKVQELKLGQKDVAFLATCRALQLAPADDGIRAEVERLAEDTQSHEALAAVYEEVVEGLPHGPLAEKIYLVLAKVYDRRLDDPDSAETALRKVLESDATNEMALDALAEMFLRRTRYKDYAIALEQKLEATSSIDGRKQILREIARIYDGHLSDPQEAVGALLRALGLEPDEETLDLLIALYRRQKAWAEVANTLIRACGLASTDQKRAQLQIDAGQVYERELNDDVGAIVAYREALEFEPKSLPALEALERLYTKTDQPSDLLAVYDRQLELAEDYRDQVKALFKSASIWESKFQNLPNADAAIERILSIDSQNLAAIKALERVRRAQGRWEELIPVIERHVQLSNSPPEQAELCVGMGDLFHQQLKQVDRAATAYHRALDLDPQSRPAMHALGNLYERSGNWSLAVEMLQREAEGSGTAPESVDLYYRMGRINEDMLLDLPSAKGSYLEAVRLDPRCVPAIRALKTLYEREKDWTSYESALIQETESIDEPELKSQALIEVGRHHAERKEDPKSATAWYEEALRLVPDSLEAAKPLADIYIASENWERAERMQEIVTAKLTQSLALDKDDALSHELCRQLYRLGYVSEKLAKKDKALAAYERAYQLDATYLPALEGLGNSLVQVGRLDDALKVFQTILIHHRDYLTDLEVVEIYWQLGDIHQSLQQFDRAQNHFEKALGIDPGHETSLRALISLADSAARFDRSADYRQRLIQVLDGDSKFEMCVELGSLAREKLSDAHMAIDAYLAAHKIRPDSLMVMDGLYVLYRETRQGPKAAEMLERMLARPELREDNEKTKLVYFALGEIARDELGEIDRALAAFNSALDLDPRFLRAFGALEALLVSQKQWKQLEDNYVRMIHRLPKTPETHAARMALWRALADLYLRVLQQEDAALMAYQVVAAGLPEDSAIQEAYAQLASRKAGNEDQAIAAYRRAMVNTDSPGRICSAFAELAARRKDYDSAYLAAQVIRDLIGEPGENEKEILGKLAPYAKQKEVAQRGLTDPLWHLHLFHPKVRGPLSDLMGVLYEHAGYLYSLPLSHYQLNPKKHRIDVATAQEYQIHHYRYVARLLGMEAIDLYSPFLTATRERLAKRAKDPVPDPQVGVEICHTHPICLRVGGKFFSEHGQKEVYYWLGRTLALARPELALSKRLAPERLAAVLQAAISLSTDRFPFTVNPKLIDTERQALSKALSEPARVSLDRAVRPYLEIAAPRDLVDFIEGAELTAVRTGLFVAGEPEPAKKMVLGESGSAYRLSAPSKIREMMIFALSEDLHALRIAVGTQLEVKTRRT